MNGPTLTLDIDSCTFSVAFDRYDATRSRYRYRIAIDSHGIADEGDDLTLPGTEIDLLAALAFLATNVSKYPSAWPNLHRAGADFDQYSDTARQVLGQWSVAR